MKETASGFAALLLVGLFISSPFLTDSGVGTGEAANYSLSAADFVTQARDGVYPPLVGQSEYAFNGRIHPLRTAPYIGHLAALIDLATGHSLNFWAIQNLEIAASLIAAVFSMYACLRRAAAAPRAMAVVLAACYGLSPGVLSVVYSMNLFMTAMTLPWVPLVICSAIRAQRGCELGDAMLLAVGLGVSWEAHPPVAFWLTVVSALLLLPRAAAGRIRGREWLWLAAGALLCGSLAAFGFVSALTVTNYGQISAASNVDLLLSEVRRVFADSLRPVSETANSLGDFQLGYLYWVILASAAGLAALRGRLQALWLAAIAAFLLVMTTPVPFVTGWIWRHVPAVTVALTNQWPMQRLYLIVTALSLFALALAVPRLGPVPKSLRDAAYLAVAGAAAWTAFQAFRFVGQGFSVRGPGDRSALVHRPENINLSIISYAILGAPPSFDSGPMDPAMEFRLLRRFDARAISGNWEAAAEQAGAEQTGTFASTTDSEGAVSFGPKLILQPGRHYLLSVDLLGAPRAGTLQLTGRSIYREYPVTPEPSSWGFGIASGGRHPISLWTTGSEQDEVEVLFLEPGSGARQGEIANFTFKEFDVARLPVVLESLVPLRMRVRAPEACYVETPRLFVDGYRATVNGAAVRVQASPDGLAMLAVPRGESAVEVRYPGPAVLRAAFRITLCAVLVAGASLALLFVPGLHTLRGRAGLLLKRIAAAAWGRRRGIAAAVLILAALVGGARYWELGRPESGPLHVRLVLPRGQTNRQQPVLVTGKKFAGTFVYLVYQDPSHVRVGVDVWGVLGCLSEPVETDYFAEQDMVISTGALYPEGQSDLVGMPAAELADLRGRIRVWLNGRLVIDRSARDFPASNREVAIGENRLGGSSCEPRFSGTILSAERQKVPAP
jgi:hypothetical protein